MLRQPISTLFPYTTLFRSRVEDLLHREVHSDYQFVTETSLHLIDAGGKRFRPLFTLLAAQIGPRPEDDDVLTAADRKSTRLNSSHGYISYAVFCLKKKTNK